jgi:hypothetical protein
MKKLLKEYGIFSDMQYFEIIAESFVNGQHIQAKNQFNAMTKEYKKSFIKNALTHWNSGITQRIIIELIDLI